VTKKLKVLPDNKPWYEEGLHFECTGCGKCCTGAPGYTWVSPEEIQVMADFLKMPVDKFKRSYLRKVGKRFSLIEFSKNYDCVFLKDKRCSIYSVRPTQCRTFPWWAENLNSPEAWREAANRCEGIQKQAPVIKLETIEEQLAIQNRYVESLDQK